MSALRKGEAVNTSRTMNPFLHVQLNNNLFTRFEKTVTRMLYCYSLLNFLIMTFLMKYFSFRFFSTWWVGLSWKTSYFKSFWCWSKVFKYWLIQFLGLPCFLGLHKQISTFSITKFFLKVFISISKNSKKLEPTCTMFILLVSLILSSIDYGLSEVTQQFEIAPLDSTLAS